MRFPPQGSAGAVRGLAKLDGGVSPVILQHGLDLLAAQTHVGAPAPGKALLQGSPLPGERRQAGLRLAYQVAQAGAQIAAARDHRLAAGPPIRALNGRARRRSGIGSLADLALRDGSAPFRSWSLSPRAS